MSNEGTHEHHQVCPTNWTSKRTIHPSNHCLCKSKGQVVIAALAGYSRCPSTQLLHPVAFPGQIGYVIPPSSGAVSSQLEVPKRLPKGGVPEASLSDSRRTSAGFFWKRRSSSCALSFLRMSEHLTLSLSRCAQPPFGGSSFWQLVSMISFFWPLPKAHNRRWGLESGGLVNCELYLLSPPYLRSLAWDSNSPPAQREQSTVFFSTEKKWPQTWRCWLLLLFGESCYLCLLKGVDCSLARSESVSK